MAFTMRGVSAGVKYEPVGHPLPRVAPAGMKPVQETPTKPVDYAALSAGYGALLGALVLGARERPGGRGDFREEIPALGLATFALSKMIAKEKVETWVREPFVEETPQGRRPRARGCATRSASC